MKVGYTEFSFGYAFTENLLRSTSYGTTGAPVFPNLIQEAQAGYDVRIDFPAVPIFFQYKLPELMIRESAFEIVGGQCPGLSTPFFRIPMMRRDLSRQHELLIGLEARYPSCVFYAAPCLADINAFNDAYNRAAVVQSSMFFSPADIGPLPDDRPHSIAYKHGLAVGYFCSEPKPIPVLTFEGLLAQIGKQLEEPRFADASRSARETLDTVLALASPRWQQLRQPIADRLRIRLGSRPDGLARSSEEVQIVSDLLVAREIARVDIGVDLVLAQPR